MANCTTDSTGKCSFTNIPAGMYTVTVTKQPYNVWTGQINVTMTQTFTIYLTQAVTGYTVTIQVKDQTTGAALQSALVELT